MALLELPEELNTPEITGLIQKLTLYTHLRDETKKKYMAAKRRYEYQQKVLDTVEAEVKAEAEKILSEKGTLPWVIK